MNNSTFAITNEREEITEEKLIEIFNRIKLNREKILYPENPKKINKWIEKIMNRLGWYRQKEIMIIREQDIFRPPFYLYDPHAHFKDDIDEIDFILREYPQGKVIKPEAMRKLK